MLANLVRWLSVYLVIKSSFVVPAFYLTSDISDTQTVDKKFADIMVQASIKRFAKERLGTSAFIAEADDPKTHIFFASLESAVEQFRWTSKGSNVSGELFKLNAAFFDTFSPNALADRYEGGYYLGIHVALFVAINEFTMFCFAQRNFFVDLGDPSKESSPKPWDERLPGVWLIDNTLQGGGVDYEHSKQLIPTNSERYICSQLLAFLMTRFVWLHELAHCFNGHVDLVQQQRIAMRLHELPHGLGLAGKSKVSAHPITNEQKKILRCLELDADESAFFANCSIQMRDMENIEGIRELDPAVALRMTIFASYAMVWLFDVFQDYAKSAVGETHPTPSLRLQNLLQTAKSRLYSEERCFEIIHEKALREFDSVKAAIPTMFTFGTLRDMAHSDQLADELQELEPERAKVASLLRPFEFSLKS